MSRIEVDGQGISYRSEGSGPVAILLHSSSSHSGQWGALRNLLTPDFTVITPDLHGYGQSDPLPRDGRPYFERDREIVAVLVEKFGGPAHLVGHSLGGTVALHAAQQLGEQIASLTLIEPVQFSLLEETGAPEQSEYHEIATIVNGLNRLQKPLEAARHFVDFWVGDGAFKRMDDKTRAYVADTIERVSDDWAGILQYAPGQLTVADLAGLKMPCQIIRGGATRASARVICDILRDNLPDAGLNEVPGLGHMAAASDPKEINKIIVKFLRAQRARP